MEEWIILWGRQELNRYKDKYATLAGGNSVACSYCHDEIETEMHIYVECEVTGEFWQILVLGGLQGCTYPSPEGTSTLWARKGATF